MYIDEACNGEDDEGEPAEVHEEVETALRDLMRRLADWFYRYLEDDYEFRTGDEAAEEGIEANEYTFTEDGEREDA